MNEQQMTEWLLKNGFKQSKHFDEDCISDENEIYYIHLVSVNYWQIWSGGNYFDFKMPKTEEELKAIVSNLLGIKHL